MVHVEMGITHKEPGPYFINLPKFGLILSDRVQTHVQYEWRNVHVHKEKMKRKGRTMKKNHFRTLIALVLALMMLATGTVTAFAAETSKKSPTADLSLMERIQNDDLGGMTADALAHVVTWATKENPQTLLPELSRAVINSPVGQAADSYYEAEHFYVTSFDGTKINCTLFKSKQGSQWNGKGHVVICAHGFQVNQLAAMLQVPMFTDLGYDVITFDQRQAGDSDHTKSTMGVNEAKDVGAIADWTRARYGEDVVLGIYGQSMGAATVMTYSSQDPNLGFLIEDCGYASFKGTCRNIAGKYLPFVDFDEFWKYAVPYSDVNGVTYDDCNPIESVKQLDPNVPAMFIHGEGDMYIDPENVDLLYDAKQGIKTKKTYPLVGHSQSQMFVKSYPQDIENFLAENGLTCTK